MTLFESTHAGIAHLRAARQNVGERTDFPIFHLFLDNALRSVDFSNAGGIPVLARVAKVLEVGALAHNDAELVVDVIAASQITRTNS